MIPSEARLLVGRKTKRGINAGILVAARPMFCSSLVMEEAIVSEQSRYKSLKGDLHAPDLERPPTQDSLKPSVTKRMIKRVHRPTAIIG